MSEVEFCKKCRTLPIPVKTNGDKHAVICLKCNAKTGWFDYIHDATTQWNQDNDYLITLR